MKAVNLIPAEQRRGGTASGSGVGPYVLLGVLALVLAMSAAYALAARSVDHKRDDLASVRARTQSAQAEVQQLNAYTAFAALRQQREGTVRSLATSRFDWSHALHEVARTIPSNAWLTSLRATVSPDVAVTNGTADPLRSSVQLPAIELVGCTTSQDKVAGVVSSMRRIDGVQRVSMSSSEKADGNGGAAGASAGAGATSSNVTVGADCRTVSTRFPKFSMTLFFDAPSGANAKTTAQGTTP